MVDYTWEQCIYGNRPLRQYIYIDPALDLIIVRLGRSEGGVKDWPLFFQQIADYYKNYE